MIGKLPRPKGGFALPNHKYRGPYNPLHKQLDANNKPLPWQEPFNQVNAISLKHEICYRDNNTNQGKSKCDKSMLNQLTATKPSNIRERFDKKLVQAVISAKYKLGVGFKNGYRRRVVGKMS